MMLPTKQGIVQALHQPIIDSEYQLTHTVAIGQALQQPEGLLCAQI